MEELLNVNEAAKVLRISVSTLRMWCFLKKIPYVKVGGRCVRFRALDLEKVVADGFVETEQ